LRPHANTRQPGLYSWSSRAYVENQSTRAAPQSGHKRHNHRTLNGNDVSTGRPPLLEILSSQELPCESPAVQRGSNSPGPPTPVQLIAMASPRVVKDLASTAQSALQHARHRPVTGSSCRLQSPETISTTAKLTYSTVTEIMLRLDFRGQTRRHFRLIVDAETPSGLPDQYDFTGRLPPSIQNLPPCACRRRGCLNMAQDPWGFARDTQCYTPPVHHSNRCWMCAASTTLTDGGRPVFDPVSIRLTPSHEAVSSYSK